MFCPVTTFAEVAMPFQLKEVCPFIRFILALLGGRLSLAKKPWLHPCLCRPRISPRRRRPCAISRCLHYAYNQESVHSTTVLKPIGPLAHTRRWDGHHKNNVYANAYIKMATPAGRLVTCTTWADCHIRRYSWRTVALSRFQHAI